MVRPSSSVTTAGLSGDTMLSASRWVPLYEEPPLFTCTILTLNKSVIVASLRSPFNTRKPLVLDDFFNCFSSLFQPFGVLFETKCFAVVVHVRSAIVFGVAAFDVATVATVGVLVYRLALRLCGGGGGGFGGLVGVLGGVGGFVESSSLAAFVGFGA